MFAHSIWAYLRPNGFNFKITRLWSANENQCVSKRPFQVSLCSVQPQGGKQLVVLALAAYGYPQAVLAQGDARAVSHDYPFLLEVVVDGLGVVKEGEKEVGVCRINLLAGRQKVERLNHTAAFEQYNLDPFVHLERVFQGLNSLLLGEHVDVVRVFHLVEHVNDSFLRKGHAEPYGGTSPCLAHGVEHDEVGIFPQVKTQRTLAGEVGIGLVNDDNAVKAFQCLYYFLPVDVVAGRIVRRTNPYELSILVTCGKQAVGCSLERVVKKHCSVFHIIDVCAHFVHAVCWLDGDNIVNTRTCKAAVSKVNRLVGAVAEEYVFRRNAFHGGQALFQFTLQGVGIAVERGVVRIFVGIEKNLCTAASELVACAAVRLQRKYVGTY